MDIFEAFETRFSCVAYLDKPVEPETVRDLLGRAARTASNRNLQPWHVHALMDEPLDRFNQVASSAVTDQNPHDLVTELPVFPDVL